MAKAFSITIHPEPISGEYLSASDAMRQVLDFIDALEKSETIEGGARQIVWRLTNAHTNSPPLTVEMRPYPVRPALSVDLEANRVSGLFDNSMRQLLAGNIPDWFDAEVSKPIRRFLERNTNGIGRTDILLEGNEPLSITSQGARAAILALERFELDEEIDQRDWSRTEYGMVEGEIFSLTRWNGKPAIVLLERLSGQRATCVLSDELANKVGPAHRWREAWEGKRIFVTGALYYNKDSILKRADATEITDVPWDDVSLADIRRAELIGDDPVGGLQALRGERFG